MLHISTVFVSKPGHISYAEAMSRMRMWLDFRKIETSSFKLAPEGREGFEITFGTNSHAVLFQSEFMWPPPQALSSSRRVCDQVSDLRASLSATD
jgi:outer membrane lipoprotein-sorting protein